MTKQAKQDVYTRVTEKVVAGLQKDGLKWFCPWTKYDLDMPINNKTGKEYKGINILLLSAACAENGYECNEWLTYKQCSDQGGQVKKGSKSEMVIYWQVSFVDKASNWYKNEDAVKAAGLTMADVKKRFAAKWFNVFNIAQCTDIEPMRTARPLDTTNDLTPIERAEAIFNNYPEAKRPTLSHGGESAFYRPSTHSVQMPEMNRFESEDAYYATLFHELVHSTGHESILDRDLMNGFGTDKYAKEELVAEIGSMFLMGLTGLEVRNDNQQAYVNGWIAKLTKEPKLAISAAQRAMKAVDFITEG
jgi:antirestriction protein ArdC